MFGHMRKSSIVVFSLVAALWAGSPAQAQTAPSAPAPRGAKVRIARWLDIQNATLNLRYRFIDTSAGIVATNQLQHRQSLRARVKFDKPGRYALNFGIFTGTRFTSGWDNTGWGINDTQKNFNLKTLYLAAQPAAGIGVEIGGLSLAHGESTEITAYDDDGYIAGERLRIRRPARLFFDEISVTNAYFSGTGAASVPVHRRLPHIDEPNYQQFLLGKSLGARAAVSADYTIERGRRTWREAVRLRIRETRIVDAIVLEHYQRTNAGPASGFAVAVERTLTRKLRVNGGYARIDPGHGSLNGDRFNIGRRVFAVATYQLSPPLQVSWYVTAAVGRNGVLPQRTLYNTALTYDMLPALKRKGWL